MKPTRKKTFVLEREKQSFKWKKVLHLNVLWAFCEMREITAIDTYVSNFNT